jgi:hypothetical protein
MKLTSMQFDGDGGYDTPMNAGATAAAASPAYQDGDDRIARNSAAAGRAAKADKIATALTPTPGIPGDDAHKGMMARSNAMSPMTQATPAAKAKAPKAIDKSNWDKGTKVPESTVKAVKDAGRGNMGAVPQRIVKNDAIGLSAPGYVGSQLQYNAPVSKEYKEAVKRVYPNEVKTPRSPSFNESSPNAKPFPKVAAPKTKIETVKKLRNAEITEANKQAPKNDQVAYAIINGLKGGAEAYGASTKTRSQISGTQTKTQKAQAERRAEMASNKTAAASKPAAAEKIKVSQATVDAVKKAGKAKATGAANTKGSSAEYREAVKRIYPTSKKK